MIEIWWFSGSPFAWWAMLSAEARGVPYTAHLLSVSKRENRTPEYLALNPRGRVPVLRDGDFVLSESTAVVAYLDSIGSAPPLLGSEPRRTARIWERISQVLADVNPALDPFVDPVFGGGTPEAIRAGAAGLAAEFDIAEAALLPGPFLCGEISAADTALYPFVQYALRAAGKDAARAADPGILPLAARWPRLAAWAERIEAIPGYERTYPPHWRG
jgi:glutathione S-transferase